MVSALDARRPVQKIHLPARTTGTCFIFAAMPDSTNKPAGKAHWAAKGDKRLFLWEKASTAQGAALGTILFVHGSSEASTPVFDLQIPGRANSSAMDWFASRGFDTWCVDLEGYGRSTKDRSHNSDIATGAGGPPGTGGPIPSPRGGSPLLPFRDFPCSLRGPPFSGNVPPLPRGPPPP